MLAIWKYPFQVQDHFTISMPTGARLLDVQVQNETPCIWALVDPGALKESREFRLAGTGHDISEKEAERYIGTFQLGGGVFIGHLFEIS